MKMTTVHHADGSFTIEFPDGVKFGPYGPNKCTAIHPGSGMRCQSWNGHIGNHGAFDERTPAGEFKHRWHDSK